MKKTDLAMIILIASVSAVAAYLVAQVAFGGLTTQPITIKTIDKITSVVEEPDANIFNDRAINPAVEVTVDGAGRSSGSDEAE